MKTPYPHQDEHANEIAKRDTYALWWSPRTGKTLTTTLGLKRAGIERVIVLCPSVVKPVWESELSEHGFDVEMYKPSGKRKPAQSLVINYESVWRPKAAVDLTQYDAIVFDESIRLQNYNSKGMAFWFANLKRLPKKRILLSGAPCPESVLQVAPQLWLLNGGSSRFMDFYEYLYNNWTYNEMSYKWKPNTTEVAKRLENAMSLAGHTLDQKDIGVEVVKVYEYLTATPSKREKEVFKAIRTATEYKNKDGKVMPLFAHDADSERQRFQLYRQASSGLNMLDGLNPESITSSKLIALRDFITNIHDDYKDERFVVFTAYRHTVRNVCELLRGKGLEVGTLTGDDNEDERNENLKQFQAGELDVMVVNVVVGKMGIDLSLANYLIYAENSYSGDARIQSEERATRLDKKGVVQVIDCVLDVTPNVDKSVAEAVKSKRDFNIKLLNNVK